MSHFEKIPAYIIEEILRLERERQQHEDSRPRLEIPSTLPLRDESPRTDDETSRAPIVINIYDNFDT